MLMISAFTQAISANQAASTNKIENIGFLVVTSDRGYAGNEAVRDAFTPLKINQNAELVFLTDERSQPYLDQAKQNLTAAGAQKIVLLPLFMAIENPRYQQMMSMLAINEKDSLPIDIARSFGQSYFAVEMLSQRFQNAKIKPNQSVIIAGYGADSFASSNAMAAELDTIAQKAASDVSLGQTHTLVWPVSGKQSSKTLDKSAWQRVQELGADKPTTIIPMHFGKRLDSMMSFDQYLLRKHQTGVNFISPADDETRYFTHWMQREVNRFNFLSGQGGQPGIVFLAHGSDFHWNQTMRDAVQQLREKYPLEFAFSMADAPSIRRAVERLEKRGVSAVVVVRVFGMKSSFRSSIERLIGADVEATQMSHQSAAGHAGHGMSHGMKMSPVPRLMTTTMVTTAGGLGDHKLFAQVLLERAKALSVDPSKETVIVVAHGKGQEKANQQWLAVLESLTQQMKSMGGQQFKNIRFQTWREDWADKRVSRIESVRSIIEDAKQSGGTAIVVAARTTGKGPSEEFLTGLDFKAGAGFAPHPLFERWIEEQIKIGLEQIKQSSIGNHQSDHAHHQEHGMARISGL